MLYDFPTLARQLEGGPGGGASELAWIAASIREPGPFWSALLEYSAGLRSPAPRSRLGVRVDLYHDMIVRHLSLRPAFRWYERARGMQEISYSELHARVTRRAGEWSGQKVAAGDTVAIVQPVGPEWLVNMLTALRMGVTASFVPPFGDRFVADRIAALGPKHIASEVTYAPLLAGFEALVLADGPRLSYPDQWVSWAPKETAALVFSPLLEPLLTPKKLTAEVAYLSALRDGLLVHRLEPGAALGAPGFHDLQHQPAMVFAALLAGATYVHLPAEEVERDPRLLTDQAFRSVGITVPIREALVRSPERTGTWDHWFKSPEEPFDPDAWRSFAKDLRLEKTPSSNLLVDPGISGAALFSRRRPGASDLHLLPAPGMPAALYELNGGGDEAAGSFGIFAAKPAQKPAKEGHVLLTRSGADYIYAGTLTPRREGRVYPAADVAKALEDLPFVTGSYALPIITGGVASRALFTLLVFTGSEHPDEAAKAEPERRAILERVIAARVGVDALPDLLRFFPLYPRRKKGKVDEVWCDVQYRTGLLARKAKHPAFLALTALRARGVEDLMPGPGS